MKKLGFIAGLIGLTLLSSCSCVVENSFKGLVWGFQQLAGDGYFPSPEILSLGNFERVEVSMAKVFEDGVSNNEIQLRFINGQGKNLHDSEELLARKCAEAYAEEFSKIHEYDRIKIMFIQTDPFQQDNFAMSEYTFEVKDLIRKPEL